MKRRSESATLVMPAIALALALALALGACAAPPAATPSPAGPTEPMSEPPSASALGTAGPMTEAPNATATPPAATGSAAPTPTDELLALELTDVRSGEAFTLGELAATDGPVLLEPMAIWCTSCRAQQNEVKRAHEAGAAFTSVSLDVQLDEHPEDLARYAADQDWDWRFAMADAALYRLLQERFNVAATHPPSTPLIVIERDGTVRPLEFGVGVRSAEQLIDELDAG